MEGRTVEEAYRRILKVKTFKKEIVFYCSKFQGILETIGQRKLASVTSW
jgi:hypothetical protein